MNGNDLAALRDARLLERLSSVLEAADPVPPDVVEAARAAFRERRPWSDRPHSGTLPPASPPRR